MDLRKTVSLLPLLLLLLGLCNAHLDAVHSTDEDSASDMETEDMSTTILRANNASDVFLMEGDLMMPRTRSAMKCFNKAYSCLWPKSANGKVEIPVSISPEYDRAEMQEIKDAMRAMESKTCIRFIPRATQSVYVHIEPKFGCFSALGRLGDRQVVSLQRVACMKGGIIQHELMHMLGIYHEHARSDRDRYVKINRENIYTYQLHNFKKQDTNNLGVPYDYSSIMHYGRNAFGKPRMETMVPIPDSTVPIGQRESMSPLDIVKLNLLYKC